MSASELVLLSPDPAVRAEPGTLLPAVELLPVRIRAISPDAQWPRLLTEDSSASAVVVDATGDLARARTLAQEIAVLRPDLGVLVVVAEGGLVAISAEWNIDDLVLTGVGPAELDARLRLLRGRAASSGPEDPIERGALVIAEATYTARLRGRPMELTYKEFELLKFLAQHSGIVFTRAQLLHEVWGFDFYGGARTVDVHVRRLRAKLGAEYEGMIGTVRNVGYKFVHSSHSSHSAADRAARARAETEAGQPSPEQYAQPGEGTEP